MTFVDTDAAIALVDGCVQEVWPVETADVRLVRALAFDRGLAAAREG